MKRTYIKPECLTLNDEVEMVILAGSPDATINTPGGGDSGKEIVVGGDDEPIGARGYSLFGDDDF